MCCFTVLFALTALSTITTNTHTLRQRYENNCTKPQYRQKKVTRSNMHPLHQPMSSVHFPDTRMSYVTTDVHFFLKICPNTSLFTAITLNNTEKYLKSQKCPKIFKIYGFFAYFYRKYFQYFFSLSYIF